MTLDNIKEEIMRANSIVILTHENPDGDAIGSSLAMYNVLKNLNKSVDVIIPEIARTYNFLPRIDEAMKQTDVSNYDLAISVDCADLKRIDGDSNIFENAKVTVSIDHHGTNTMFANINYVDPVSPACAQILASLFNYWEFEITKEIGECLITGIITDTGGFKYSNVTVETFEFAAELLAKGVNISKIYERTMQVMPFSKFELSKIATDRVELLEDGKIAFTYINIEDEKKVNAEVGDHEGIVEIGRSIEGVQVSIFLRESEKGYKASLRSNEAVNVADVCIIFGGGGHPRAAGCSMACSLESAKEKLINEIKLQMKK